jgi:alpha-soluble NSF attachment protein
MDSIGDTTKAHLLMKEAEKKYKGGFLKFLGSKSERAEEATELVKQAANIFKLAKDWENAANAYLRCAQIEKENKGDPADQFLEAANMQKKYNPATAIKTMELAIEALCADGKITQAARIKKTIGETYEADKQFLLAAQNYQDAVDLYNMEGENNTTTNNILLKVPELRIIAEENKEHIGEAIKIYEQVANKYLEHKLTAPSAKDLFFRATILHLANDDTVGAENALEKYSDLDPTFGSSRECKFIRELIKAVEAKNVQGYSDACWEFNNITPLDRWKTTVLNRAKTILEKSVKDEFSTI